MLSPRAGLKQLEFPSAGRPMSSRSWRRARNADFGRLPKGNLINAKCALAAPPHYPPLVGPLHPCPALVPHTSNNLLSDLLCLCLSHSRL